MAFGRTRMAGLVLAMTASLLVASTAPTVADDKNDIKKKQDTVNQQLSDAKNQATESSAALQTAVTALNKANASLAAAQSKLSQTQGQLTVAQAENARLKSELASAQAKLATATRELEAATKQYEASRKQVQAFVVTRAMQGDTGLQAVSQLLAGQSTTEFTTQMVSNSAVLDAEVAKTQQLEADDVILQTRREAIEALRDQIATQKAQAESNVAQMQVLTQQASDEESSVSTLAASAQTAKASAQAAADADLAQVTALESERNRLQSQLQSIVASELAKAGASSSSSSTQVIGTGALSYPVSAAITSPYGMRLHPILHVWKLHDGTDFGVACGTPVHAAADGTILQQYYNSAYGNRIILNNGVLRGVSVITTYNHLTSFALATGTQVKRGQLIGYSGTTGYSTGCHLHFMVLVNGQTVNPAGWL